MSALPPLVEPGPPLSAAQLDRYSRHLLLDRIGETGQRRLAAARVLLVGAGGLGSPALSYLAAAGVGTIGVIDDDVVELSNLQRQIVHTVADIGTAKTASAAASIAAQNPLVEVVQHPVRLTAANAIDLISGYHLVLDGSDTFATRYLVNDACTLLGTPWVWGSVLQFAGQLSVFWAGRGPTLRDLHPQPPEPGSVPSCAEAGVLGVVCATIGSAMATEAVKLICGVGQTLLGRVLTYDALSASYRTIPLRPDPEGRPAVELADDLDCGLPASAEISGSELAVLLAADAPVTLVDVREVDEQARGMLPDALSMPLGQVLSGAVTEQLRERLSAGPVVLYCASGARSLRAAQSLAAAGVTQLRSLRGGMNSWPARHVIAPPVAATSGRPRSDL